MLSISTDYNNGLLFIKLKGELTKDTFNKFDKKITNKIKKLNICNLIFNVEKLNLIDYRGIYKLLYYYELIKNIKGKTYLYGNNINIENIFKKSRILNYIKEIKDINLIKG